LHLFFALSRRFGEEPMETSAGFFQIGESGLSEYRHSQHPDDDFLDAPD
jgi:hypothetical protein